ncbi:MAG: hypothetical protein LUG52_07560 [Clostridia bacterium]|nr:hypothetical protein [Clostridia bacterium]
MTVSEIITTVMTAAANHPMWIVVLTILIPSLIEISPIKVNPWSALAKAAGKIINADVIAKLEAVEEAEKEMQEQLKERIRVEDERNADAQRERILRFNVELMRALPHQREDFIEILAVIDEYERYCKEHPEYKNNRAVHAVANINRVYDERLVKNDFYKADAREG